MTVSAIFLVTLVILSIQITYSTVLL